MGMKKNKVHTTVDKGYFYAGGNTHKIVKASGKVGTNEKNIKKRASNLKHEENFTLFGYLEFYNTTKTQLEVIESHTKEVLERHLTHAGNDHFQFPIVKGKKEFQYRMFCLSALLIAMIEADRRGYKYTFHWIR